MARAKNQGNGRLEEALAILIQNQAAFVGQLTETDKQITETSRINSERFARIEERFVRIEALLLEHNRILADHTRILEALTEAVRDKIGFRAPEQR